LQIKKAGENFKMAKGGIGPASESVLLLERGK